MATIPIWRRANNCRASTLESGRDVKRVQWTILELNSSTGPAEHLVRIARWSKMRAFSKSLPRKRSCHCIAGSWPMRFVPWRWMPFKRRTPAIPACPWAWPTSPKCSGTIISSTTRATHRWADRDRFVISNGHGSMLLYALLHLTGYPLPLEQLQRFRQLGSHTAGHPEHDLQAGYRDHDGPAWARARECRGHGAR